jgi:hypothetical protein
MDSAAKASQELLRETESHMREKMTLSLAVQQQRELAAIAELHLQEKIRKLRMRRARDDVSASRRDAYISKTDICITH